MIACASPNPARLLRRIVPLAVRGKKRCRMHGGAPASPLERAKMIDVREAG